MSNVAEEYTIEDGALRIKILWDSDPVSPRDSDNLGIMRVIRAPRRSKPIIEEPSIAVNFGENGVVDDHAVFVLLPLFWFSHSGDRVSTEQFSCPWDSWSCGYIFTTIERVEEAFGKITDENREELKKKVKECLECEVNDFDSYVSGDVFGFIVESLVDNEVIAEDSCWGFLGMTYAKSSAEEAARHLPRQRKLPFEQQQLPLESPTQEST